MLLIMKIVESKYRKMIISALNKAKAEKDFFNSIAELKHFLDELEDIALSKAIKEGEKTSDIPFTRIERILGIK